MMVLAKLVDHGVEHSQYFQGCGTAFSGFEEVVTGVGQCFDEAYEDALEGIAQTHNGEVSEAVDNVLTDLDTLPERGTYSVTDYLRDNGMEITDDCELYHYVSIRYTLDT
jgi:hypothetical protein